MTPANPVSGICRWFMAVWLTLPVTGFADELIGKNGERFIGKVIEETSETVVFESETVGRQVIPRSRISELKRTPAVTSTATNLPSVVESAGASSATNKLWQPPGVGKDGFDWLELKSSEWLKGHLRYVQNKKVDFESDKLEDLSLEFKDIRQLYSSKPMFTKFEGRDQLFGSVALSNDVVEVLGPEQIQLPRDQLTGITPGGKREINLWSGKANIGLNFQSGNTKQTTMNASAELARRTPATQLLLNYLGNYGEVEGTENANNHRVNLSYDIRLNRDWFVRPLQAEYYRDQLANISHRGTVGVGVGYYIFDQDDLEWKVAAGPGYQYTRFATVGPNESNHASTAAAMFQTRFKADITKRLTFIQDFTGTLTGEEAGLYSHHLVSTVEFEIKRHLDLDVSFVWDYIQNPQAEADRTVPQHSDLRFTLGLGVRF